MSLVSLPSYLLCKKYSHTRKRCRETCRETESHLAHQLFEVESRRGTPIFLNQVCRSRGWKGRQWTLWPKEECTEIRYYHVPYEIWRPLTILVSTLLFLHRIFLCFKLSVGLNDRSDWPFSDMFKDVFRSTTSNPLHRRIKLRICGCVSQFLFLL